jgi:hypothetical protein
MSNKDAQKLVTAGAIPYLICLLQIRAAEGQGLEIVLLTLGCLSHDSITANTIYQTYTLETFIEIFKTSSSSVTIGLVAWCLGRICRSVNIATTLVKLNLVLHHVSSSWRTDSNHECHITAMLPDRTALLMSWSSTSKSDGFDLDSQPVEHRSGGRLMVEAVVNLPCCHLHITQSYVTLFHYI